MHLLGKVALVAGLGLAVYFGFELYLLSRGTAEPQPMTVAALGRKGPLANTHVTVTDFQAAEQFLIEMENNRWVRVWIPLFTPDGEWTERPVMAFVSGVQNDAELSAKMSGDQLTGVVTNGMQNFGTNQQGQIAPAYPGVDLSDTIAFQIGRAFPSPLIAIPLFLLGVVLMLGGGGVAFGLIKTSRV